MPIPLLSIPPRRRAAYVPDDPLLTAQEAATECGRALSTFWRDLRAGKLPPPYYVTPRCPRWRRSELRAVVDAASRQPVREPPRRMHAR
jgi:predicted DNA-binding transcriptional regulator AlpA